MNPPRPSGRDRRLGAAGDHHVGVAVLDESRRPRRSRGRRRARRHGRRGSGPCSRSGSTGCPATMLMIMPGTKNGLTFAQAARAVRGVRLLDHRQPADARADAHARALLVAVPALEPGVADRLHRGDEAELDERVLAPRLLRREPLRPSKSLTSPAMRTGKPDASKRVIGPMPDRPARIDAQASSTPTPTGETIPRPVTTTRRRDMRVGRCRKERKGRDGARRPTRAPVAPGGRESAPRPQRRRYFFRCAPT